ncbi:hypothetical protein [Streptomyces hoynatensis]|uniref:Uncharacterized protein n=1 Tax=Streptomyces hoynatensis TaxID=1141874 RepID=A0A3A9ZBT4_9ACTN|nr:hypothetical protein [Streptomyces hoynatensis]RKN45750.1 hypothetical protein D7294_04635 [Streptomyces hoynatensis]
MSQEGSGFGGRQEGPGVPQGGPYGSPPPGQGAPGPGFGQQVPPPGAQPPAPPQGQPGAYPQAQPGAYPPPGQPGPQPYPPQGQSYPPAGPQWQVPPAPGPQGGGPGRPGRSRTAGIAIAAVVAIAALATVIVVAVNGSGDDEADGGSGGSDGSGETHQLVLPVTSGDFRISGQARTSDSLDADNLASIGVTGAESTTGLYYAGITPDEAGALTDLSQLGGREVSTLAVIGVWGTVADPEAAAAGLLEVGAGLQGENGGTAITLVGEPQDMQPSGIGEAVMKCQYAEAPDPATGQTAQVPLCAWADDHTVGFTVLQRQNATGTVDVPLDVAADHTSALRTASLVETSSSPAD